MPLKPHHSSHPESHRSSQPEISIEHYYSDAAIKQLNAHGRRFFLSNEFIDRTGFHLTENYEMI